MKISFFILIAAAMITGCSDSNSSSSSAATNNAASNPSSANYLGTMVRAQKSMENKIDTTSLNNDIQQFNVAEGRYPKDLNELVEKHYIGKIPDAPYGYKLSYDATSGTVTAVKE